MFYLCCKYTHFNLTFYCDALYYYHEIMRWFYSVLCSFLPSENVFAHCDIPCGIYDPKPAQIAAATVLKMVEKLEALPQQSQSIDDRGNFVRMVWTKEEHARKCKEELLILWTDFFKPEHVSAFPTLHDTFWKAAKLCSENKQHISRDSATKLVAAVDEIAVMFQKAKAAAKT